MDKIMLEVCCGSAEDVIEAWTIYAEQSFFSGGCLYPPEDRYHLIDGMAIQHMRDSIG